MRVLFPDVVVGGVKLRPLTLAQINDLAPVIEKVVNAMIKKGITVENVKDRINDIMFAVIPYSSEILRTVLNADTEVVDKIEVGAAIDIFREVIIQNASYIRNCISPLVAEIQTVLS